MTAPRFKPLPANAKRDFALAGHALKDAAKHMAAGDRNTGRPILCCARALLMSALEQALAEVHGIALRLTEVDALCRDASDEYVAEELRKMTGTGPEGPA